MEANNRRIKILTRFFIHSFNSIILTGRQKLRMWPDCEADGNEFTKTPSDTGERDEMDRFEKVSRQYLPTEIKTISLTNIAASYVQLIAT